MSDPDMAHTRPRDRDMRDDEFRRLRSASARMGRDPLLIQAAGGNTSLKSGGTMTIKASGTWLQDAETDEIFVDVDLRRLLAAISAEEASDDMSAFVAGSTLRASIETPVHAVMPQPSVLHVHHVDTIALAVLDDAKARLVPMLRGLSWRFVPYVKPGLQLAEAMAVEAMGEAVDIYILGNHGLVVGGETVDAAVALIEDVARRLALPVRGSAPADMQRLQTLAAGSAYTPAGDPAVHAIATNAVTLAKASAGTLYPDHVIFLGPGVSVLREGERLEEGVRRLAAERGKAPALIAVPGAGVLMAKDAPPAAHALARCLADVASRIPEDAPLRLFDEREVYALMHWDAEVYRQGLKRAGE